MKNIVDLIIEEKIADNVFRASNIATDCQLWKLKTEAEQLACVRLYRDWRNSGIYKKSDTSACFEKAIAGEAVPVDSMFEGALLSEANK